MPSVFKDIIDRKIPAHIVYEDEHTVAFLDAHPLCEGHTLVVPKKEHADIFDMPPQELAHVMTATKNVVTLLRKTLGCQGINILHASGKSAQQSVPHFHLHIIPRHDGDGMNLWPHVGVKHFDLDIVHKKIVR
ncbi:TPA: HIT family protein [Candidatus Woesearchaeota archaeon]|nr:HIT family protein [Candidatus Woesearchaeota archaeon]